MAGEAKPTTPQEWLIHLMERDERSMAWVSEKIGHNHAYVSQYLSRGVPQRGLDERDRAKLAALFDVPADVFKQAEDGESAVKHTVTNARPQSDSEQTRKVEDRVKMVEEMVLTNARAIAALQERINLLEARLLAVTPQRNTKANPL